MNYLGRSVQSCATGLHEYHRVVRRMRACVRRGVEPCALRGELDRLQFDVEVDVRARRGPTAAERMTEVEAEVFRPVVRRLGGILAELSVVTDAAECSRRLDAALVLLRSAVGQLRRRRDMGRIAYRGRESRCGVP